MSIAIRLSAGVALVRSTISGSYFGEKTNKRMLLLMLADILHVLRKRVLSACPYCEGPEHVVFFAYPYCSWERSANEIMNGLIRQFYLKTMTFNGITASDIALATYSLNHRPRIWLDVKNSQHIFVCPLQYR